MQLPRATESQELIVEIGGVPIALLTSDIECQSLIRHRYASYLALAAKPEFVFSIELVSSGIFDPDADVSVRLQNGEWRLERGDFMATWNPETRIGHIRQSSNPYSTDSVLRIVHTLLLARTGGFLLHASSAVKDGKAFLFSGISGAGKTTMVRLKPSNAELLTDEASYIRKVGADYFAYGTPFAGELGEPGANISAPVGALYLLEKAEENSVTRIDPTDAVRRLMRNILFFAHDAELVRLVFESACAFVSRVPVFQLSFYPDQRVWDLVGREDDIAR
jgi:hypothetical protein